MICKDYLKSKITVPQVYHKLLPRKNIADIINNTSLDEVISFIAPYGYGKTRAVISWLKESGQNAAWVTLDETDNTEQTLFASLSAAILRLTGWQGIADDILSEPKYINNQQDFLWETIKTAEERTCDKILVLDRLCFIDNPILLRQIKELISILLKRWRVMLISRSGLPAVFNDLILKRHICLLTLNELGFSPEETAEYFSMNELTVSQQNILQIHSETEGWPASLNVILTISRGGSVEYGEAARECITGFFETELWAKLDENTRDFLLKTSILDKLTPASSNAVTDLGSTYPILRCLFVNGLLISGFDGGKSYRYHKVFRSFLQYKLKLSSIDERKLYKKIAWWMFEKEEYEQAFPYFFKAGDLYGLSCLFRIINSADIGVERYLELTSCITSLNVEDLWGYPLIVAKMALIHFALGNLTEMQRLYMIYLEWIEPGVLSISPEEYAELVWEAGWLNYLNPDEPTLNNKYKEWFDYVEYDPRLQILHHYRAAIYRFPSMLRGIRDYCPVLDSLEENMQQNIQQNKEAKYSSISNEVSLWCLDIIRVEHAYELENFAFAEEMIKNIITEVEGRQLADLYFICIVLLVKIVRAIHDPKEINALTARLETMILNSGYTFLLTRFHAFKLRNRLAEGIPGQTEEFKEENSACVEKPYFYLLYRHMTLVRALLSTGNYNEATMILGNLERLCHQYNRIMDLIEVYILRSVADYGLGNEEGACRYIIKALNKARKFGFIRIFSDDAKDLWPILELLSDEVKDHYVKSIIISCKKMLARSGIRIRHKNQVQSELTKTELKILKILDTGMSYKELALDNGIKVSTVKSHICSIYSKLGVDNRTSAIMTARNLGIIN